MVKNSKQLFSEVIDTWLLHEEKIIKESSLARYKLLINRYIRPILGSYKIKNLKLDIINNFFNDKLANINASLSQNMVHDIISLVKQILKFGNIEIKVKVPSKIQPKINTFTEVERLKIEKNSLIYNNRKSFGILLSLYMGLRIGEICALKNKDFDLENRTIKVEHTLIRIQKIDDDKRTKVILSNPKSRNSIRIIPIPNKLFPFIKSYVLDKDKENFFLTNSVTFTEPRSYYNHYLRCLENWKIKKHKFHDLRHTFATYSIEKGFEPKVLSEILGHSNITTTFNLYVHPSMETKRKYMDCL